ncbi:hypothetical protein ADL21_39140 [Streptomyces albus subsp. albus]|nr:hypothetical protein ADL21_39140 [Streptomyces albus subsp. albus]
MGAVVCVLGGQEHSSRIEAAPGFPGPFGSLAAGRMCGGGGTGRPWLADTTDAIVSRLPTVGLSMDYEIFLMARIVEEHRRPGDTRTATAAGIEHTARVFTAAALIVAVVMGALAASGLLALKMIGTGLAVAVLLDATLVRAVLVPAFIRLAGRANWWLPRVTARRGRCRCAGRL